MEQAVVKILLLGICGYGSNYIKEISERDIPGIKIETVVCEVPVEKVIAAAQSVLKTGEVGDGKIFVFAVENAVRIRTGVEGAEAIMDES